MVSRRLKYLYFILLPFFGLKGFANDTLKYTVKVSNQYFESIDSAEVVVVCKTDNKKIKAINSNKLEQGYYYFSSLPDEFTITVSHYKFEKQIRQVNGKNVKTKDNILFYLGKERDHYFYECEASTGCYKFPYQSPAPLGIALSDFGIRHAKKALKVLDSLGFEMDSTFSKDLPLSGTIIIKRKDGKKIDYTGSEDIRMLRNNQNFALVGPVVRITEDKFDLNNRQNKYYKIIGYRFSVVFECHQLPIEGCIDDIEKMGFKIDKEKKATFLGGGFYNVEVYYKDDSIGENIINKTNFILTNYNNIKAIY